MNPVFDVRTEATLAKGGIPSVWRLLSAAASVNPKLVKTGLGKLYKIDGLNAADALRYLKLYDKATAPAETDTPIATFAIPASGKFSFDFGSIGLQFSLGMGYRLTGAAADNDTTALTAGDITCLNVFYC